jgi:predicted RNA-binding protein (virulence factor B family)
MAVCQEWDKHTEDIKARFQFSKALFGKSRFTQ